MYPKRKFQSLNSGSARTQIFDALRNQSTSYYRHLVFYSLHLNPDVLRVWADLCRSVRLGV